MKTFCWDSREGFAVKFCLLFAWTMIGIVGMLQEKMVAADTAIIEMNCARNGLSDVQCKKLVIGSTKLAIQGYFIPKCEERNSKLDQDCSYTILGPIK